jgi:8-oxo-dGTP pyrophosphatase MutT (NUDIX family)
VPVLREKSCGVVPYREEEGVVLYLIISSALTRREHWEFPKGGVEAGERELDTALRELSEETGVVAVDIVKGFREPIHYIYRRPEGLVSKQVVYFLGHVRDPKVVLREVEAKDFRWASFEDAKRLLRHANARSLLDRAHARVTGQPPPAPAPEAPAAAPEVGATAAAAVGDPAEKKDAPKRRRRRNRRRRGRGAQAHGAPQAVPPAEGDRHPSTREIHKK